MGFKPKQPVSSITAQITRPHSISNSPHFVLSLTEPWGFFVKFGLKKKKVKILGRVKNSMNIKASISSPSRIFKMFYPTDLQKPVQINLVFFYPFLRWGESYTQGESKSEKNSLK